MSSSPAPEGGLTRRTRIRWIVTLALVAVAGLAVATHRLELGPLHAEAERLNGGVAFLLLVVLPLAGFPASVTHVAAGVRFGAALGLPLVSLSIGIQLLASYALVHRWRPWFARRFSAVVRRVPPSAHASVAVLAALLPGVPFAAINYTLPLLGLRLRTILVYCWSVDTLRATVTVMLGDQSDRFTPLRLAVLGVYALLLAAASNWTYRRLRDRLGASPAAAGGPTQPASHRSGPC